MSDHLAEGVAPAPFYLGFDYAPARRPFTYDLFLSSSSEVADVPGFGNLRDHVEDLVVRSFSPALSSYGNAALHVVRWEQALANALPGETLNETFVRTALTCHHTLVLLMTHLGQGTREEVEAVVQQRKPISIVRFDPPDGYESDFDRRDIDEFINGLPRRILYQSCGVPGSKTAYEALALVLAGAAIAAYQTFLKETQPSLAERRD